ncbi:MAG: DUF3467 domain-containing protein [Desulfuromonadaceae bacterium]|nr:DUF3467 domain-containing protein [Desulfuromonadaceae bacterium]
MRWLSNFCDAIKGVIVKKQQQEIKLEIQIDDETASGQYINMAVVNHNDSEFVLDCIYVQPQAPKAKIQSRLITSPRNAKRLLLALQNNIHTYEQQFGVIDLRESTEPVNKFSKPVH